MHEILFRGKRFDNGKWVEGYVGTAFTIDENKKVKSRHFTALDCLGWSLQVLVSDETIGQYTGLTDKNGTKIFEGDILRDDDNEENGVVEFVDGEFCVVFGNLETHGIADIACCCYVIGNIHDNPELMKGGE